MITTASNMNAINVIGTYITSQKKHSNFKLALYFKIVCAKLPPPHYSHGANWFNTSSKCTDWDFFHLVFLLLSVSISISFIRKRNYICCKRTSRFLRRRRPFDLVIIPFNYAIFIFNVCYIPINLVVLLLFCLTMDNHRVNINVASPLGTVVK